MEEGRWLYSLQANGAAIEVYSVPGLDLVCTLQPSFPKYRCGIKENVMYVASVANCSFYQPTTTQVETFSLPTGTPGSPETWPRLNSEPFPLLFSDAELLDFGSESKLLNLHTKSTRTVLHDLDKSTKCMTPCLHNKTLLLFANEENKLRVYESSLGNYAHTRAIPRHVAGFNFQSLTAIPISQTQVLICAGRRMMRRKGQRQAAYVLVYNTEIRFAEEAGKLPGGIRSVRSHAVCAGKLYLLMEGRVLVICDLETGMAASICIKDWSAIKGLLWTHQRHFSRLPGGILKAITGQYILGRDQASP